MAMDAFRIKYVYRAFSILAAFSISLSTNVGVFAYERPDFSSAMTHSDGILIARFPFRKAKDSKSESTDKSNDAIGASEPDSSGKSSAFDINRNGSGDPNNSSAASTSANTGSDASTNESNDASRGADSVSNKFESESSDSQKSASSKSTAKAPKGKEKNDKKQERSLKADQAKKNKELSKKAAEDAKRDNEQSEKVKKPKEQSDKAAEKSKKGKEQFERAPEKSKSSAKSEKNRARTVQKEEPRSAPANTISNTTGAAAAASGYQADSALLSLLNDLARSLKNPAEQSKFGDESQKLVVSMAADVLNTALEHKSNANRIVDKQSSSGSTGMNAEAWSSGDVKVSDDCRGSLAAVWAKRENGLLNVTIAGTCRDKIAPNGKKVGEYVVVITARSTIQKGFDIQSQGDVKFWLANLASVSVEADCCAPADSAASSDDGSSGQAVSTSSNANSETRMLQQHALVVLQTVLTERQRTAGAVAERTANGALPNIVRAQDSSQLIADNPPESRATTTVNVAMPSKNSGEESLHRVAKPNEYANGTAAKQNNDNAPKSSKQNDEADRKAARQNEEFGRKAAKQSAEAARKLARENEEDARKAKDANEEATRTAKAEYEEEQRKAEKEKKNAERKAAKEREAQERQALKEREKEDQRLASEDQRKQHAQEKLAAQAESRKGTVYSAEDEFAVRDDYSTRRNAKYLNREDLILEEATRQVEAERNAGIDTRRFYPSERGTSANMKLAEANRQAENDRREAADMRAPVSDEKMTRDDMILAEAAREAEAERREANMRNGEAPQQVDIGDSKTSLRPTLSSTGKSTEVTPSALITDADANGSQTGYGWEMRPNAKEKPSRWAGAEADEPANQAPTGAPKQIALKPSDAVFKNLENCRLILPQRCIAGQYITATVVDSKNEGQEGIEVSFNGTNYTTDEHGQVSYTIPDDTASGATLDVAMTGSKEAKRSTIEVLQPLSTSAEQNTPAIERISHIVSSNGTITLDGHNFDGIAHRNRITIDDLNDAEVVAASPVQLKVSVPIDLKPGKHTAALDIGLAKSNNAQFELLTTEVVSHPRDPNGKLIVRVLGTTNKVSVHVINKTPDVIKITKGNDLKATTTGGDNNNLVLPMYRLRKGSYRVNATVE